MTSMRPENLAIFVCYGFLRGRCIGYLLLIMYAVHNLLTTFWIVVYVILSLHPAPAPALLPLLRMGVLPLNATDSSGIRWFDMPEVGVGIQVSSFYCCCVAVETVAVRS